MRIEEQKASDVSGMKIPAETVSKEVLPIRLEEGRILSARVLSVENGTALLRTQEGIILRARLELDIPLLPGTQADLTVVEQFSGLPVLRIDPDSVIPQPGRVLIQYPETYPDDKQIRHLLYMLEEQNIPVSEKTVSFLQHVLKQNPDISPERAVFITANRLPQSAVQNLFEAGEKPSRVIEQMAEQIKTELKSEPDTELNTELKAEPNAEQDAEPVPDGQNKRLSTSEITGRDAAQRPRMSPAEKEVSGGGAVNADREPVDEVLPDRIPVKSEIGPEFSKADPLPAAELPETYIEYVKGTQSPAGVQPDQRETGVTGALMYLLRQAAGMKAVLDNDSPGLISLLQSGFKKDDAGRGENVIPARFLDLLKSLFAEIGGAGGEDGQRLKKAKDELLFKLSIFHEALERTNFENKAQLLEQTQRLLNGMKAVMDISQFVYAQIPVTLSEKNNTVEMYVFRKKNSARKIDPANVSILLALDLPSIGHTESLIVIKGKEVSLRFEVSNEEAKAVFLRNTTELYRMLAEIGYKLVGTHVSLCKEATRIETAMLHLIAYESGISSGFDLIV